MVYHILNLHKKKCIFATKSPASLMPTTQNTLRVDLHGMYVEDAMELLRERVARAPRGTEKIIVIHGYNRGSALKEAVRRFRSPRVVEVAPSFLNEGETVIWLRS